MPDERCCLDCGNGPLIPVAVFHEIKGFDQPRTQGGTNAVALKERTGRVLCAGCMAKRKAGISPDQGSML